jgi:hypothetical protein
MGSTSMAAVDTTVAARNLKLNLTVTAGQFAGGGMTFDSCVNGMAFSAVQFTAAVSMGSLSGCVWQVQVQTQDQRPTTATNPSGGTCTAATCYQYPAYAISMALNATPVTITAPFPQFTGASAIPTRTQIVGLQWQANSSQGTGTCTVELRIDDIKLIP